ncbi:MAG TPA: uracil-DNA glycosylase [Gammaproteobacteria bacterium]|nr:uracil-DNA glycosylase [Gammaproteobacteria bacterium]
MMLNEHTRLAYLKAMGIQAWSLKTAPAAVDNDAEQSVDHVESPAQNTSHVVKNNADANQTISAKDISSLDWQALQQTVSQCQLCELHLTRTQTVFGVGNQNADLLIVGEAPGADEDRIGEPFVGRAGKLLDAMLQAIQLDRQQVYIANVLKCRPPQNRDPHTSEIICCEAYLQRQITLIQPKVILAVGRIAAHHLLLTQTAVGSLRGRKHSYNGIPLVVTYHPAYLLRSPADKGKAWQDLLQVKSLLSK